MVTGRVAPLELVEKPTNCAGAMPWKKALIPNGVQNLISAP